MTRRLALLMPAILRVAMGEVLVLRTALAEAHADLHDTNTVTEPLDMLPLRERERLIRRETLLREPSERVEFNALRAEQYAVSDAELEEFAYRDLTADERVRLVEYAKGMREANVILLMEWSNTIDQLEELLGEDHPDLIENQESIDGRQE